MTLSFTPARCRVLALAAALALPGLAVAQSGPLSARLQSEFAAKAKRQGLSAADVANLLVTDSYFDASTGLTHTYVQQQVNGVAIFNTTGAIHTDKSGQVVMSYLDFVPNANQKANGSTPGLTPEQAVAATAVALKLPRPSGLERSLEGRLTEGMKFNGGGISPREIPVRLVYAQVGGQLVLGYHVEIMQLDEQHSWSTLVDARSGKLLQKIDLTVSEQVTFRQSVAQSQARAHRAVSPAGQRNLAAANSLTVFAFPLEAPNEGGRTDVPLKAVGDTYSPFGWQVAQSSATFADSYSLLSKGKYLTRGNNVAAYSDRSNKKNGVSTANLAAITTSPDGGGSLSFDFPYDQAKGSVYNTSAAITNLFYVNNMMHDVMMAHGFDEVAGNYQYVNKTTSGKAADPVRAEAQDGFARNNANFTPSADGSPGLMQMYLFDNYTTTLDITNGGDANGSYKFGRASFGPTLDRKPISGKLVLVNDGKSDDGGAHGCVTPYVNAAAVSGNIALIERGGCPQLAITPRANNNFTGKVKRAAANGAIGAIIFDSLATSTVLVSPSGTDTAGIKIPTIFLSGMDGAKIRDAIRAGATPNVSAAAADFDGSLDNGVVSHEYGHGISNRLTGGPSKANCLVSSTTDGSTQIQGEGWSDFFALWMTTKPGDDGTEARGIGTYVVGQAITDDGIRTKPYSTNMVIDPLTYGYLNPTGPQTTTYQETHNSGEVWCAMLWDLNWQYIKKYGYNADVYAATGGNNIALKLVLDACKIQICNPSYVAARNAILRVDSLSGGENHDLLWNIFARRGLGYSATSGTRDNGYPYFDGIVEAYDLPKGVAVIVLATKNNVLSSSALEAYPNPTQDRLTVRTLLGSKADVQVTMLDLLGKTVLAPVAVPAAQMHQSGVELRTDNLASGIYLVRVATTEGIYTTKVTVQH